MVKSAVYDPLFPAQIVLKEDCSYLIFFSDGSWYEVTKADTSQIFRPTLKFMRAKEVKRQIRYGPVDADFFWFKSPHKLEYQKTMSLIIYCSFDFHSFPFDHHTCDLNFGSSAILPDNMMLNPTKLRFRNHLRKYGDGKLKIHQSRLPFEIQIQSEEPFIHFEAGFNYSYTGLRFYFERNDLGLLLGGYYGPTLIFALLSLVSFFINPDVVSNSKRPKENCP